MAHLEEFESDHGCDCFWVRVVWSAVVGLENSPGFELRVCSFDWSAE